MRARSGAQYTYECGMAAEGILAAVVAMMMDARAWALVVEIADGRLRP